MLAVAPGVALTPPAQPMTTRPGAADVPGLNAMTGAPPPKLASWALDAR